MDKIMRLPRTLLTLFAVLMLFAVPVEGADFQKGLDAYKKKDYATALREWRPLAKQGNAPAQYNLGLMHYRGQGVLQDYKTAADLFVSAAIQGYDLAEYNIGLMYRKGLGVLQNYKIAVYWYKLAAEHGYVPAQYSLGLMYYDGQGVLQDFARTHMWWNIAASQGYENAIKNRDSVSKRMTPAQIAEAQRLARECVKKNYKGC